MQMVVLALYHSNLEVADWWKYFL